MTFKHYFFLSSLFFIFFFSGCTDHGRHALISNWDSSMESVFLGKEFWANRLQDWQVRNGRIECLNGKDALRTVHILTHEINDDKSGFKIELKLGVIHDERLENDAFAGILIGGGSLDIDYRGRSLIFNRPGKNGGLLAGVNGKGELVILDMEKNLEPLARSEPVPALIDNLGNGLSIIASIQPVNDHYIINFTEVSTTTTISCEIPGEKITGNIAIVGHKGGIAGEGSFWFNDLSLSGSKLSIDPNRTLGPIVSTMHTVSRNTLKMSVQMMPVGPRQPKEIFLKFKPEEEDIWEPEIRSKINKDGYIAVFKIEDWDDSRSYDYQVEYKYSSNQGPGTNAVYKGTIRKNPIDKEAFIIAAFTGNNNTSWQNNGYDRTRLFFPHEDLTSKVAKHKPDFLFYSGDQLYEGSPSPPDRSGMPSSTIDYLYKWYLWCWAHRDLTRDIPSVAIPDDHDVYHGNLWGAGGEIPPKGPVDGVYPEHYQDGFEGHWIQDQGGYRMGTQFVNMVERTQTSNLPDPVDPVPVKNDIGVYFTDIKYGGFSFAVLEDRKFKSAPAKILVDDKIINGFSQIEGYDATKADRDYAQLLGKRQLDFISNWVQDWEDTWMKVSLTQTIFANVSTYPDSFKTDAGTPRLQPLPQGVIPTDYNVAKDMDSNGWPQSGRNRALEELRRGYTFMLAGDQHLGSVVHHGINDWEDAGISFCVPSVANVWPRRWFPPKPGLNHQEDKPGYTGRYFDGFGNRITVHAASNPYVSNVYPAELHDRAPGYGIVKLYKKEQKIVIECWPRHVDPTESGAKQYPDWPLTFNLMDNYGRQAVEWLPTINTTGLENPPVVQVIDKTTGEPIYTVRATDSSFDAKVFKKGSYSISVGEPGTDKWELLDNIQSIAEKGSQTIDLAF
jgi:hypothetical protein